MFQTYLEKLNNKLKLSKNAPSINSTENDNSTFLNFEWTLQNILIELGPNSHALLINFLCLPFLQPIPLPGLSSILGLLISYIGIAAILNKPISVPKFIANKKIEIRSVEKMVQFLILIEKEQCGSASSLKKKQKNKNSAIFEKRNHVRITTFCNNNCIF